MEGQKQVRRWKPASRLPQTAAASETAESADSPKWVFVGAAGAADAAGARVAARAAWRPNLEGRRAQRAPEAASRDPEDEVAGEKPAAARRTQRSPEVDGVGGRCRREARSRTGAAAAQEEAPGGLPADARQTDGKASGVKAETAEMERRSAKLRADRDGERLQAERQRESEEAEQRSAAEEEGKEEERRRRIAAEAEEVARGRAEAVEEAHARAVEMAMAVAKSHARARAEEARVRQTQRRVRADSAGQTDEKVGDVKASNDPVKKLRVVRPCWKGAGSACEDTAGRAEGPRKETAGRAEGPRKADDAPRAKEDDDAPRAKEASAAAEAVEAGSSRHLSSHSTLATSRHAEIGNRSLYSARPVSAGAENEIASTFPKRSSAAAKPRARPRKARPLAEGVDTRLTEGLLKDNAFRVEPGVMFNLKAVSYIDDQELDSLLAWSMTCKSFRTFAGRSILDFKADAGPNLVLEGPYQRLNRLAATLVAVATRHLDEGESLAVLQLILNRYKNGNDAVKRHHHRCRQICVSIGAEREVECQGTSVVMRSGDCLPLRAELHSVPPAKSVSQPRLSVCLFYGSTDEFAQQKISVNAVDGSRGFYPWWEHPQDQNGRRQR